MILSYNTTVLSSPSGSLSLVLYLLSLEVDLDFLRSFDLLSLDLDLERPRLGSFDLDLLRSF